MEMPGSGPWAPELLVVSINVLTSLGGGGGCEDVVSKNKTQDSCSSSLCVLFNVSPLESHYIAVKSITVQLVWTLISAYVWELV